MSAQRFVLCAPAACAAALIASLSAGCLDQAPPAAVDPALGTGALLSVDTVGFTDVVGFHFTIDRVACDAADTFHPMRIEADVDLLDLILPGDFELLRHQADAESQALAADLFVPLQPGCYQVDAYPARDFPASGWLPSEDCAPASADGVEVLDGLSEEVVLISQCQVRDEG